MKKIDTIKEILERGVEKIIEKKKLVKRLSSGKRLRIKHGIDPTGSKIHLGRAAQLWKLKAFQELGHQIVLILGDFTAQIGDASDKTSMRKPLSKKEVLENMKDYKFQIAKILNIKNVEIYQNSKWLEKFTLEDLLPLAMHFTAQQMIQRRNFKERWEKKKPIGVHEMIYPILQGYDSLKINADVEIGGADQLFNLKIGREIQKMFSQQPQEIVTLKMLLGTDGRKMSTSWGNVINITDEPEKMYGKIMSMKDELIGEYFELCTKLPWKEVKEIQRELKLGKLNPRDTKAKLAKEIVKLYHGEKAAQKAEIEFNRVFREKKLPSKIPVLKYLKKKNILLLELVCKTRLITSKTHAKRLITQGGVRIDNKIKTNWKEKIKLRNGMIIRIGKWKFVKIKI